MSIAAVMGGLGLAAQAYSILNPAEGSYSQVNPYYDDYVTQMQTALTKQENLASRYTGLAEQYQADLGQTAGRAAGIAQRMEDVRQPGVNEWFQNFTSNVPELQAIATTFAEEATMDAGRTIDEQVQAAQTQAIDQVASQFAGANPYSGAASAAMASAALQPALSAATQMEQQKSGIASNTFQNLAQQGMGLSYQSTQDQFTNALQQLQEALGAVGTQAGIQSNQLQGAQSLAGTYGQLAGQTASTLGQLSSPTYQASQGIDYAGNLASLLQGASSYADKYFPSSGNAPDVEDQQARTSYDLNTALNFNNGMYNVSDDLLYSTPVNSIGYGSPFFTSNFNF